MNVSSVDGGTVKINDAIATTYPASSTLATGTSVILQAIPSLGYEFAGWSGSLTGNENPVTIEMTCPKNITAGWQSSTVGPVLNHVLRQEPSIESVVAGIGDQRNEERGLAPRHSCFRSCEVTSLSA